MSGLTEYIRTDLVQEIVAEAVRAEREACAEVALEYPVPIGCTKSAIEIAAAIRATGYDTHLFSLAAEGDDRLRNQLIRAVAVAGFAATNIMLLSVSVWSGAEAATRDLFHWISAFIAGPTLIYSGRFFYQSAWNALRHGRTNMDVPISIGVVLTTALSLFETFVGGAHAYFDGAVMLLFFLLTGRWLDSVMRDRARDGVSALLKHKAAGALVLADDGTRFAAPIPAFTLSVPRTLH